MQKTWFLFITGSFAGIIATLLILFLFSRSVIRWISGKFIKRLMSDRYSENIWEMFTASMRLKPTVALENSLRAETGKVIMRPFGSPRKFLNFDQLVFSPAQLSVMPEDHYTAVDTEVIIGPKANKPLKLQIPILLGAVGYGASVSEKLKIAMAEGTAAVGTATNVGQGGFLPEDRAAAKYMIMQYTTAEWSKDPTILKQADAIEIHIGQGAQATAAKIIPAEELQGRAQKVLGLENGEPAVLPSRYEEIQEPDDLKTLICALRKLTDGKPIGVKICAGNRLEEDLEIAVKAGADFISLDGSQAGTKGCAPIVQDDFGLPTIYALCRAVQYLKKRRVKDKISLLIGGGFFVPGDCLKALALGADAVYLGTAAIWAMTHKQVTKTLPFEPPTQLLWYNGTQTDKFDVEKAAKNLKNFLQSFVQEIEIAVRAIGKTSVHTVNTDDLIALDEWTSKVTNIPLAYDND